MAQLSNSHLYRFAMAPLAACLVGTCLGIVASIGAEINHLRASLQEESVEELRKVMNFEQGWIKVRAAEALLNSSRLAGVREVFLREVDLHSNIPEYRIGIWRVLAQASSQEHREQWVNLIRDAFLDESGSDRVHAVESLAKLGYCIQEKERAYFEAASCSDDSGLALFALWALCSSGESCGCHIIAEYLQSSDHVARLRAAFVLCQLPNLSVCYQAKLRKAAIKEKTGSHAYAYLIVSSFLVSSDNGDQFEVARCRSELVRLAKDGKPSEMRVVCDALAKNGVASDLSLVAELLNNDDPDVRIAAANAALQIGQRSRQSRNQTEMGYHAPTSIWQVCQFNVRPRSNLNHMMVSCDTATIGAEYTRQ